MEQPIVVIPGAAPDGPAQPSADFAAGVAAATAVELAETATDAAETAERAQTAAAEATVAADSAHIAAGTADDAARDAHALPGLLEGLVDDMATTRPPAVVTTMILIMPPRRTETSVWAKNRQPPTVTRANARSNR